MRSAYKKTHFKRTRSNLAHKKYKPNYKREDAICGKAFQQLPQMVSFKDTAQNVGDLHELQYHFVDFFVIITIFGQLNQTLRQILTL